MTLIDEIREDILASRDSRIWDDFINETNTISEKVFTSSTHYLLEFIQNAEDAGRRRTDSVDGQMAIFISKDRIKIEHNGKPFSKDDVDSLCGVRSQKDPGEGDIGYLGIGFKSVFKVTDEPQIYSGGYSFKFDRERCEEEWDFEVPWQIIPFTSKPAEEIDESKTTFIIPFRSDEDYEKTRRELEEIGVHIFLFLDWLKELRVVNEEEGNERYIEHSEQQRGVTWKREAPQNITYFDNGLEEEQEIDERIVRVESTITDNEDIHRFIIFKGTFGVPRDVRQAEETQGANRGKVLKRRISIAFPLDENKNLTAELPGKMRRGLYSFLPLEEANTGTKFLIQGDFIVQPGRDDMLWEAEWNKWIIKKVKEVAEQALRYFQQNPDREKWRSQYIPLFEFEKVESDVYHELIKPILREGIENNIDREELVVPCLCCGENISIDNAVKFEEETRGFYEDELVTRHDLELIFEGNDMHFIGLDVDVGRRQVKELGIPKLHDREVIQNKIESGDEIQFLSRLYSKLVEDHSYVTKYVVTEEDEVVKEDNADLYKKSFPESVETLREEGFEIDQVLTEYTFIKPDLWERTEEYLDIDAVPYEDVSRQVVLPNLRTSAAKPSYQDAVTYAKMVKDAGLSVSDPIWVVTSDHEVVSSEFVLLGDEYGPHLEWGEFEQYLDQAFLSDQYLNIDESADGWKNLFQNTGMKGFSGDDYTTIAKDEILPKVKPGNDIDTQELITYTRILRLSGVIGGQLGSQPILVVTKENGIQTSSDVFFGSEYSPSQRWDKQSLMEVNILSTEYLNHEEDDSNKWRKFFKRTGVKETASQERIDNFGSKLLQRELGERYESVQPAGGSHDFEAVKGGETVYIELKSRSESEIKEQTLESSQSRQAIDKRENYIFAYINNIPENPEICLLSNPPEYSKDPQLVIPARALAREAERFRPSDS